MPDKTLGQAAYEAYKLLREKTYPLRRYVRWDELDKPEHAAWEAAATAAVELRRVRNVVITACQDPGCGDGCDCHG